MDKLLYVVMCEKKNGAVLRPMVFECSDDAEREAGSLERNPYVLDVWICTVPLNKKQKAAAA